MFRQMIRFAVAAACCLVMPMTVAPALAASPATPSPQPGVTIVGTLSEAQAAFAALPPPTPEQMAAAKAWLAAHPRLQGTIAKINKPTTAGQTGFSPDVSVSWFWGGFRLYLTQQDVHNIWGLVWTAGIGGAAAVLCSPGLALAVACAIGGAVIGYIVAELIWNAIGPYVPSCGVHIDFYWWGGFGWGYC